MQVLEWFQLFTNIFVICLTIFGVFLTIQVNNYLIKLNEQNLLDDVDDETMMDTETTGTLIDPN